MNDVRSTPVCRNVGAADGPAGEAAPRSGSRPELLLRRAPRAEGHQPPLAANRVTAFIGPSGCGKSTLLRIFNRMYDLYPGQRAEGQVMLDGQNVLDPSST